MPVLIACSCGKKLKAPDHAVGKRVKCPACGQPLLVKPQGQAAPEEKVKVLCGCGASLSVPKRLLGTDVKCPKCGQYVTVEPMAEEQELVGAQPTPSPAAQAEQPSRQQTVDPGDEAEGYSIQRPVCKGCGAEMEFGDVICLECGTNQKTGAAVADFNGEVEREDPHGPGAPPKALMLGIILIVAIAIAAALYFTFVRNGGNAAPSSRVDAPATPADPAPAPPPVDRRERAAPRRPADREETEIVEQERVFGDDSEWVLERYVYAPRRTADRTMLMNANRAVDMFRQVEGRQPQSLEEVEEAGYGPLQRPSEEDLSLALHPETGEVVMIRRR